MSTLPSRWDGVEQRVPESLADLRGPATGTVALPVHLGWSGLTEFDLVNPLLRMSLYRTVITGGGRSDAESYLNAELLVADWPTLRRGIGPSYRRAWETKIAALGWRSDPGAGRDAGPGAGTGHDAGAGDGGGRDAARETVADRDTGVGAVTPGWER
ncbi:hypothetical protein AB0G15_18370 [Streptosporangium sp. NPDC023825]|uniref:hypothetical protein n=1 Tax=Streptosporangium sp. NPDC023825 TaxID=3154909 RepID=UPI00341296D6